MLIKLYLEMRIPIDQFSERTEELQELVDLFKEGSGRSERSDDLVHYMKNQRKCGQWVKLDGNHAPTPPHETLSAEDMEVLIDVYKE